MFQQKKSGNPAFSQNIDRHLSVLSFFGFVQGETTTNERPCFAVAQWLRRAPPKPMIAGSIVQGVWPSSFKWCYLELYVCTCTVFSVYLHGCHFDIWICFVQLFGLKCIQ
jgi:hypothetical protein